MSDALSRQLDVFRADPGNDPAFGALEEHYFVAGDWLALADLYRKRAGAARVRRAPKLHAAVLFRLGTVLEERCDDPIAALEQYLQAAQLAPDHRQALQRARQICAARRDWTQFAALAELELRGMDDPREKAALLTAVGERWLHELEQAERALECFERACELDPQSAQAVEGRIAVYERRGESAAAAQAWERLAELRRGPERADALVAAARVYAGPLKSIERASELYRKALTHAPQHAEAIESLTLLAASGHQWHLLVDLMERRFELEPDPVRRAGLAAEIGQFQLEFLERPEAARAWLERADQLAPGDLSIHYALAKLERRSGERSALLQLLERTREIAGEALPTRLLVEASQLHAEAGQRELACERLEEAQRRAEHQLDVLWELAHGWLHLDRAERAAELLEICTTLTGRDRAQTAQCWSELGAIELDHLGDADSAREAFSQAFQADPAHPGVAARLAEVLRKQEDWATLRDLYERARRQGPEPERAAYHVALAELLTEHFQEPARAAQALEQAAALEPDSLAVVAALTRLARARGDQETWLGAAAREAELSPDPARREALAWELSAALEARSEPRQALRWLETVLSLAPASRRAREAGARILAALGAREEELAWLEPLGPLLAAEERPAHERRRARLLDALGRPAEALAAWERAYEDAPRDLETLRALETRYAAAGAAEALRGVRRSLLELLPAGEERTLCLSELAALLEQELGDAQGALAALRELEAQLPDPAPAQQRQAALLERSGQHVALTELLERMEQALPEGSPARSRSELRRAQVHRDRLGDSERALQLLRALRAREPGNHQAELEIERTLRAGGDRDALARWLQERADATPSLDQRAELLLDVAALREELGDAGAAAAAYAQAAAAAPAHELGARARAQLELLHERTQNWPALAALLEARLADTAAAERGPLHQRLAELYRARLGEPAAAAAQLEHWGRLEPARTEVWQQLEALYTELEQPAELARALEAELAAGAPPEREAALRARAAQLAAAAGDEPRAAAHFARALALEPAQAQAAQFLADHHERGGRPAEAVAVLEQQLEQRPGAAGAAARRALQLRIAALRSGPLGDTEGALRCLEAGLQAEAVPEASLSEALQALQQRCGRHAERAALCERAAAAAAEPAERALWQRRLAESLAAGQRSEDRPRAAAAWRAVLAHAPQDRAAEAALLELLRELGPPAELAALLEARLARAARGGAHEPGDSELGLRLELARACARAQRPDAALAHYRTALAQPPAPEQGAAWTEALALARELGRHADALALLEQQAEREVDPRERARLLETRAELLAGPLAQPEAAAASYRRALQLDPTRAASAAGLRAALEALGRWHAVLHCLEAGAAQAHGEQRWALLREAAERAQTWLGPDAALPWLERLRAERPQEPQTLAAIAALAREQRRAVPLLLALEEQLGAARDPAQIRALEWERADVFERALQLPACAIPALENARRAAPADGALIARLEQLYARSGRAREQLELLELRLAALPADAPERAALELRAGSLRAGALADPQGALGPLERAAAALPPGSAEHREALAALAGALLSLGRTELWVRAAEEQLRWLPDEPRSARVALRRELAQAYALQLARPAAALGQLRAIVERELRPPSPGAEASAASGADGEFARSEAELLALLRASGDPWELERRLSSRLVRQDGSGAEWLELAWLRHRTLGARTRAREAYGQALARGARERFLLRELAAVCEELGDWAGAARAAEEELELEPHEPAPARAARLRALGALCSQRLGDGERALRAYAAALTAQPTDLESLQALRRLRSARREWGEELELCQRELELVGAQGDPARRQALWLEAASLAQRAGAAPERVQQAYEQAQALAELPLAALRGWAESCRSEASAEQFAKVWGRYCDHPEASVECDDWLLLVARLEELGRADEALTRAQSAARVHSERPQPWVTVARLCEARGESLRAAEAIAEAAQRLRGADAAAHWLQAGAAVEAHDAARALDWLERACAADPASALAHAETARVAAALAHWEAVVEHAERALALGPLAAGTAASTATPAGASGAVAANEATAALALAGGRAALALGRHERAALFLREALAHAPDDRQALEAQADALEALGDLEGVRACLERRIALPGENPQRASQLQRSARALEAAGQSAAALEQYRAALAVDPQLPAAHAGAVRLLRAGGQRREAIAACEAWARSCSAEADCAQRWLEAAEIELELGELAAAQQHLRAAVAAAPALARAQRLLIQNLSAHGELEAVLGASAEALRELADDESSAPERTAIALLRGRALEASGRREDAILVYRTARARDPHSCEAVLAEARVLCESAQSGEAQQVLAAFAAAAPEPPDARLVGVWVSLAHLQAELGDAERAAESYERALRIEPRCSEARARLAQLLAARPARWRDAVQHHAALLADSPFEPALLRSLMALSLEHGDAQACALGAALLHALALEPGTPPAGRATAPQPLPFGAGWELADGLAEKLRELARLAKSPLAAVVRCLAEVDPQREPAATPQEPQPPVSLRREEQRAEFAAALRAQEEQLTAAGLLALAPDQIASLLRALVAVVQGHSGAEAEAPGSALARQLNRWTRMRLQRAMAGLELAELDAFDFANWRAELRARSAALALDRGSADLEVALDVLADPAASGALLGPARAPASSGDRCALISGCAPARLLVARVAERWCTHLLGPLH